MLRDRISAVILNKNKLLLVKAYNSDFYITPGGKIEDVETHEQALTRELHEELGIALVNSSFLISYKTTSEKTHEKQNVYCYLVVFDGKPQAKNEIAVFGWYSKNTLPRLAKGIKNILIPELAKLKII